MRIALYLFLFLFSRPSRGAENWTALLDQSGTGKRVRFGVELGGISPYSRNGQEAFAPASTAKLFTAGAMLTRFGPDFRYPTTLRWTQTGNTAEGIELIGSGDPSWAMEEFHEGLRARLDEIARSLKTAGVDRVTGELKVRAADPRWDQITVPAGWKTEDSLACMGALAQSFNLNLNCATYRLQSAGSGGWLSAGLDFPVEHRIREGESTRLSVRLERGERIHYVIEGTLKNGAQPVFRLPIYDTLPWVRALFRQALADAGITRARALPFTPSAPRAEERVFYSRPLSELLKPFLKNSVNFMGDAFLKTLAARNSAEADGSLLAPGLAALGDFLGEHGGSRDFKLNDGSGLSRTSRATPAMMMAFLERMERSPHFLSLWNALPVAGVDGTLKNRMKGTAAAGHLRAKTGTLDGVYALAGWVPDGKRFVPFVILTRTTASSSAEARQAQDRVGARLASLHAGPLSSLPEIEPFPYLSEHAGFDAQ